MIGPFGKSRARAQSFALSMAASQAVLTLVERDEECADAFSILNWREDEEERAVLQEAIAERREINKLLIECGMWFEGIGISA